MILYTKFSKKYMIEDAIKRSISKTILAEKRHNQQNYFTVGLLSIKKYNISDCQQHIIQGKSSMLNRNMNSTYKPEKKGII